MKTVLTDGYLESYLIDERGLSVKHAKRVMRAIKTLQAVWGVLDPTEEEAFRLKKALREAKRKPDTVRLYIWALKYWALALGRDLNLDVVKVPKIEKERPDGKKIPFDIIKRILGDAALSSRDRAMVLVWSICGCRLGELADIKLDAIRHAEKKILIFDTKSQRDKYAIIPGKYYPLFTTYLHDRAAWLAEHGKTTDALFISSMTSDGLTEDGCREVVYRIAERYGMDKPTPGERHKRVLHPHGFRHSATSKLRERLSAHEVQKITGHSSSAMVDYYSTADDDRIKKQVEDLEF
jgi:integrase